jgi:carbamoyltransferase
MDIAASLQVVTEEVMLGLVQHVHAKTQAKYLCLAGGVALNCVANGRILREGPFDDIWVQPASGDAGGALGAAFVGWYQYLGAVRTADGIHDAMKGGYLGPQYSNVEIKKFLDEYQVPALFIPDQELSTRVAHYLVHGAVLGWFQGRMEFGPRALGSRSILGDARSPEMQSKMNLKIKYRESFRPFAPSVLRERADEHFVLNGHSSPYMLLTAYVREDRRRVMTDEQRQLFGIDKLRVPHSDIPAVTHVDYSSRVQTVDREISPLYHALISAFAEKTGCPVIVNTSFNVRGEPIVCTPRDAYLCFMRTEMDYLVLGNYILDKKTVPPLRGDTDWRTVYELD